MIGVVCYSYIYVVECDYRFSVVVSFIFDYDSLNADGV